VRTAPADSETTLKGTRADEGDVLPTILETRWAVTRLAVRAEGAAAFVCL